MIKNTVQSIFTLSSYCFMLNAQTHVVHCSGLYEKIKHDKNTKNLNTGFDD